MTVQTSPAPVTVLVVEDNVLVRYSAVDALGEGGFHVLETATAPGAMALLEREHVDVLFTDVNMPGEFDGLELARRVRRRWPRVAVVITSGRSCPDQVVDGVRFVPKPYMADRLARLIAEVTQHSGTVRFDSIGAIVDRTGLRVDPRRGAERPSVRPDSR